MKVVHTTPEQEGAEILCGLSVATCVGFWLGGPDGCGVGFFVGLFALLFRK